MRGVRDTETELKTGQWYYLAYTYTAANSGTIKIYVDSKLTHTQQSDNPRRPTINFKFTEATIGSWNNQAWIGIIDEVRLWDRVLSGDEILDSMNRNREEFLVVEPAGKLAASWAKIKAGF